MSLLWKTAKAIEVEAMAWHEDPRSPAPEGKPISVRHSGFAGYVDVHGREDEDEESEHGGFDEDAYDNAAPEPTAHEQAHLEEHGEMPESYYARHDHAYGEAMHAKAQENEPDHENFDLGHFVGEHATEASTWHKHGTLGKVDLTQPVYATQSHVHTGHLDRNDQGDDSSWHLQHGGQDNGYLANQHPLFATHEGRVHVIDGHHRVGAALRRGDKLITGYHIDLDHPDHAHLADPDHDEDD